MSPPTPLGGVGPGHSASLVEASGTVQDSGGDRVRRAESWSWGQERKGVAGRDGTGTHTSICHRRVLSLTSGVCVLQWYNLDTAWGRESSSFGLRSPEGLTDAAGRRGSVFQRKRGSWTVLAR